MAAFAAVLAAGWSGRGEGVVSPGGPPSRIEWALVILLTTAAFLLRVPALDRIPPGLFVDEAFAGLQGVATWSGEKIPVIPEHGHPPDMPVWNQAIAASTKLFGVGVAAVRLPSAIAGVLAVPAAWLVGRSLLGAAGGVGTALFLCGSFWHVQYSRIVIDPGLLVLEGLVAGWLILGPGLVSSMAAAAAGAVAGTACYGYFAALYLPLWCLSVLGLRAVVLPAGVMRRRATLRTASFLAAFVLVMAPMLITGRLGFLVDRPGQVLIGKTTTSLAGTLVPVRNMLYPVKASAVQWAGFPPGSPRLSVFERFAFLAGLACLFSARDIAPFLRSALALWLVMAMLPELIPGEPHLSRGVGALAPLALLAGLALRTVYSRFGARVAAPVLLAGLAGACWTGVVLYRDFPAAAAVRTAYSYNNVEAAARIRELCADGPVLLTSAAMAYESGPVNRFLLWNEIRAGRILPLTRVPNLKPTIDFYRYPLNGEPVLFILGTDAYPRDRRISLVNVEGMLGHGGELERTGRLSEAEEYYRWFLGYFPDSGYARLRLGRLLSRIGRNKEAAREYGIAGRMGHPVPK
jgi:hypothetical protein